MTQTIRTQINDLANTVSGLAAAHPGVPELLVMAWAFEDAANLAHGRLRRLFDVPTKDTKEQPVTVVTVQPERKATGRKPKRREAIVNTLRSRPGASTGEIAVAAGCSTEYASTTLCRMADRGEIRRERDGMRVRWWPKENL